MSRYLKPDANVLAKLAYKACYDSDYDNNVFVPLSAGSAAFAAAIAGFTGGPLLVFAIPAVFTILGLIFLLGTFNAGGILGDKMVEKADRRFKHIADPEARAVAKPLLITITEHAAINHGTMDENVGWYGRCESCSPRLDALDKLSDAKVQNKDDLKQVEQFLKSRRELEEIQQTVRRELGIDVS